MGRMVIKKDKIKKEDEIIFIPRLNLDLGIFIFFYNFYYFV
jgi:hypothetical protein